MSADGRSFEFDFQELVADWFAGGGGASEGIKEALGRDPDFAINHDGDALAMHTVNHPDTTHIESDVWVVDPAKVMGYRQIGLGWFSPDCFPKGTMVLTRSGYRDIALIRVGDQVLSHKGQWRKVTEISSTKRPILTVRGHGHPGLQVSPEHPFYLRQNKQASPNWLPISGAGRGIYWATPHEFPAAAVPPVPGRGMATDARLLWLAGRYVGDGWSRITKTRAEVVITCGAAEAGELRLILEQWPRTLARAGNDELAWHERTTRTAVQFSTNHRGLVTWLREHFGHRAEAKGLPAWALGMDPVLRQALLDGYLSADGSVTPLFWEATTVSKALAFSVKALANSLGRTVSVYTGPNSSVIEGRRVNARAYWRLRWRHEVDKAHRQTFVCGRHEWTPIRAKSEIGPEQRVYNIGVETDESYIVEGIVVHNCKHFSKAKGGKPVSKKIRGLAWVIPRVAAKVKPRVIIMENVEEFKTWGPLKQIDGQWYPDPARKGETFDRFVARLKKLGYKVEYRELRACDYGTPTIRKRLFLIARRDGLPIVWPEPTHGNPKSLQVQSGKLLPWRTAAECIDWSIPCPSIFERKKPLADATLRRIARGVMRYVVNSDSPFIVPIANYGSGLRVNSIDDPLTTVTANPKGGAHAVVVPTLVGVGARAGQSRPRGLDEPSATIVAKADTAIVTAHISPLTHHGDRPGIAMDTPMPTITGAHRGEQAMISATLVQTGYGERQGQAARALDIGQPLGTVVGGGVKHAVVAAFLAQHNTMPNGGIHAGHAATDPVSTISASGAQQQVVTSHLIRMHDSNTRSGGTSEAGLPPARAVENTLPATGGHAGEVRAFLIAYYGTDQDPKLDEPMHTIPTKDRFGLVMVRGELYRIVDIGMRMLTPRELATAQGFPLCYIIDRRPDGTPLTKTAQVRMIGNSVCPPLAAALIRANFSHEKRQPASIRKRQRATRRMKAAA